ncbi:MAG: hypothetical protein DRO99_01830 [Candidatus Aenigmatarchaeota archaeon]|nr:MAG: hypothetical protein DRO99_01830 [Candidatus Aenigmarchaeota archaeon]
MGGFELPLRESAWLLIGAAFIIFLVAFGTTWLDPMKEWAVMVAEPDGPLFYSPDDIKAMQSVEALTCAINTVAEGKPYKEGVCAKYWEGKELDIYDPDNIWEYDFDWGPGGPPTGPFVVAKPLSGWLSGSGPGLIGTLEGRVLDVQMGKSDVFDVGRGNTLCNRIKYYYYCADTCVPGDTKIEEFDNGDQCTKRKDELTTEKYMEEEDGAELDCTFTVDRRIENVTMVKFAGVYANTSSEFDGYEDDPDKYKRIGIISDEDNPCKYHDKGTFSENIRTETLEAGEMVIKGTEDPSYPYGGMCEIKFDKAIIPKSIFSEETVQWDGSDVKVNTAAFEGNYMRILAQEGGGYGVDITGEGGKDATLTEAQLRSLGFSNVSVGQILKEFNSTKGFTSNYKYYLKFDLSITNGEKDYDDILAMREGGQKSTGVMPVEMVMHPKINFDLDFPGKTELVYVEILEINGDDYVVDTDGDGSRDRTMTKQELEEYTDYHMGGSRTHGVGDIYRSFEMRSGAIKVLEVREMTSLIMGDSEIKNTFYFIDMTGDDQMDAVLSESHAYVLGIPSDAKAGDTIGIPEYKSSKFPIKVYDGLASGGQWRISFLGITDGPGERAISPNTMLSSPHISFKPLTGAQIGYGQTYKPQYIKITSISRGEYDLYKYVDIDFTGDGVADCSTPMSEERIEKVFGTVSEGQMIEEDEHLKFDITTYSGNDDYVHYKAQVKRYRDYIDPRFEDWYNVRETLDISACSTPPANFIDSVNSGFLESQAISGNSVTTSVKVDVFGFSKAEAREICNNIEDEAFNAYLYRDDLGLDALRKTLVYRDMYITDDYIPMPYAHSIDPQPMNRVPHPMEVRVATCVVTDADCDVNNFELPQDTSNTDTAREFVTGLGDPQFVAYYEAFPEGEEVAWLMGSDDFFVMSMVIGGAINMIPFAGKLAGKGISKVIPKVVKEAVENGFRKILLKMGLRKMAGLTVKNAMASLTDDVLRKAVFEGMEEALEASARRAGLEALDQTTRKQITRNIVTMVQRGIGPDEIASALARSYKSSIGQEMSEAAFRDFMEKQVTGTFTDVVGRVVINNADDVARAVNNMKIDEVFDGVLSKQGEKSFAKGFFGPIAEDVIEKDLPQNALPSVLREAVKNKLTVHKTTIIGNIKKMVRTASSRVSDMIDAAGGKIANAPYTPWGYLKQHPILKEYVLHSRSLRFYAIDAMDELGWFDDMEEWGIPMPEEFAECLFVVPGVTKKECIILQSAAVMMIVNDKQNEKFNPHYANSVSLHRTIWPEYNINLTYEAYNYFVQVKRSRNIWEGGGPQRLMLASPCKSDLHVNKTSNVCFVPDCEADSIIEETCKGLSGDERTECVNNIYNNVCGHITVEQVKMFAFWEYSREEKQAFTKYPFYYPGSYAMTMSQVDRSENDEWSYVNPNQQATKECLSMAHIEEFLNERTVVLLIKGKDPPVKIKVPVIEVALDEDNTEGFCIQGDDHKEFMYKTMIFVGSVVVDIGLSAVTVATGGLTAPLFFLSGAAGISGAASVWLDREAEKTRMWPREQWD